MGQSASPMSARLRDNLTGWALVAPSLAIFAVFFLYPVVHTFYLSFFEWNLVKDPVFVGIENYRYLWDDDVFSDVLVNTALYSAATVVLTMSGGLAIAVMVNRQGVIYRFITSAVFTSYIVSWVGVSLLWLWLLDSDYGLLNWIVSALGFDKINWLGDPDIALWSLVGVTIWKIVGYDTVIFLAGLQAIPRDLYESAALDGAGALARFWYITLPQLLPTTLFLLVTSMVMTFQGFDVVRVMTQGGPVHATTIYVYYVYEQAFQYFHVGRASAAVVIFFVLILLVTVVQMRLFERGRS